MDLTCRKAEKYICLAGREGGQGGRAGRAGRQEAGRQEGRLASKHVALNTFACKKAAQVMSFPHCQKSCARQLGFVCDLDVTA